MTDLVKHVAQVAAQYLESEAGLKVVDAAVRKSVESAVQAATGYRSDFDNALRKTVADKLKMPDDFDLPAYHDSLVKVVLTIVNDGMEKAIAAQVESRLKEIIRPIPSSIKLSQIAQQYYDKLKERYDGGDTTEDACTIRVKEERGFVYLTLHDSEKLDYDHKADVNMGVYNGKIFSLSFGGRQIEKEMFVGNVYEFERYLFQLRANNVTVEVDRDAVEDVPTHLVD